MATIYSPESAGKERIRLSRTVILALRELMKQPEPNLMTCDLAAFVALSLEEISNGIDVSVEAWEKRGYWVKADRFRLEWEWAGISAMAMKTALASEDWGSVAMTSAKVAQKLSKVTVPVRHRMGEPWAGSWGKLFPGKKATASK